MKLFQHNPEALTTFKFINGTKKPIFLTGKAGSGKTTLLRTIVKETHKQTIIAAPTGIAALHAGGVTLHSLFQLPFGAVVPHIDFADNNSIRCELHTHQKIRKEAAKINSAKRSLIRSAELLIIDEVSMLRADILDAIDISLKHIRKNSQQNFGGLQVLFIGDMLQLPPIVKDDEWIWLQRFYTSMFFFDALVFKEEKPIVIELQKIYRQTDAEFLQLLNNLRNNIITAHDSKILNSYYKPNFSPSPTDNHIYITTHNAQAQSINSKKLAEIDSQEYSYDAIINREFPEHIYPVDYTLTLKEGAQIMFLKNDYSGRNEFYNGKIGKIAALDESEIQVELSETGEIIRVEPYTWENKRFELNKETGAIEENIIGTFSHFPIKLAWAVTVHKSQGLTFKEAIIDVSEAFAPGQIYVALSRLESLHGLVLLEKIPHEIPQQSARLLAFTNNRRTDENLSSIYSSASIEYARTNCIDAFNFSSLLDEYAKHLTTYDKSAERSTKQLYEKQITALKPEIEHIGEIGKKFQQQVAYIITQENSNAALSERVKAAHAYFEPLLNAVSQKLLELCKEAEELKGTKAFVKELHELELHVFKALQTIDKSIVLLEALSTNSEIEKQIVRTRSLKTYTKKSDNNKDKKRKPYTQKNTRETSYEMFEGGKTIQEIAQERNLTTNTIESHLRYFVAEGAIDISKFVQKQKVKQIISLIHTQETKSLKAIMEAGNNSFSYSELHFVMAYMECYNLF